MFKAVVYVTIKENVLDPQGSAVKGALHKLGFPAVDGVRIGKYIEFSINEADEATASAQVKTMCEKLLANTVVEDYRFELVRQEAEVR